MMLWVGTAEAQRRAVRRGSGRAVSAPRTRVAPARGRGYRNYRVNRPYRAYGPYYYGAYDPFFYGPYAYGHYPYYGAQYLRGSVRLQVKPEQTEVFVDGYHAGLVDSYDGFLQRLHLPPGEHEIELYLDGHESVRETFYLVEGQTYKMLHEMVPLDAGVPQPERPRPPARTYRNVDQLFDPSLGPNPDPSVDPNYDPNLEPNLDPSAGRGPSQGIEPNRVHRRRLGASEPPPNPAGAFGRGGLPNAPETSRPAPASADQFGRLTIRVQPEDAQVVIDGQTWVGGLGRLEVELGVGQHVVEVRRDGYRPYRTEVDIREGDGTGLNVSLPRVE